jgi:hypothetical protein
MIALLTAIALLVALIFVLRGPSTPNNKTITKAQRPESFSKYLVNKDGWLEVADEDRAK